LACLADAGGVWLFATPNLHASDQAPDRRRVLRVDFHDRQATEWPSMAGI
jgi:hypothetical protein